MVRAFRISYCAVRVAAFALMWASMQLGCGCFGGRTLLRDQAAYTLLDSLYGTSGFEIPVGMIGKATFDVEQYRVRGQFALSARRGGEVVFEFSSGSLFGSAREDVFFSLIRDTVRVVDRERGRYYEGEEIDALIGEALGGSIDTRKLVSLLLGTPPRADEMTDLRMSLTSSGDIVFSANAPGGKARIAFSAGARRLREIRWPVALEGAAMGELRAVYAWGSRAEEYSVLKEMVLLIEDRGWRVKLVSGS